MEGIKIACLYSWGCQKTQILNVDAELINFVLNQKSSSEEINKICGILKKLIPYPCYKSLANLAKQDDCFKEGIIRAYWLGDNQINGGNNCRLTHNFYVLEKIKELKASNFLSTDAVNLLLNCMISWAQVIKITSKEKAVVVNQRLFCNKCGQKIFLGEEEREIGIKLINKPRKRDFISIHLGSAREKIKSVQVEAVKRNTREALRAVNY